MLTDEELDAFISGLYISVQAQAATLDDGAGKDLLSPDDEANVTLYIDHDNIDPMLWDSRMELEEVGIRAALSAAEEYMVVDPASDEPDPHRGIYFVAATFERVAAQLRDLGAMVEKSDTPQELLLSLAKGYEQHFREYVKRYEELPLEKAKE